MANQFDLVAGSKIPFFPRFNTEDDPSLSGDDSVNQSVLDVISSASLCWLMVSCKNRIQAIHRPISFLSTGILGSQSSIHSPFVQFFWIFDKIMHTPRANVKINHLDLAIDHRRCAALVRTLHCNQNKTTKMKNIARKKRKGSSYWHDNDSLAMDRSGSPTKKTIVFVPNM